MVGPPLIQPLVDLNVRFSTPVLPGETLRTEIWCDDAAVSFRTKVLERDVVVLNNEPRLVAPSLR